MGLFNKKYCDLCGNKIGLLGNSKLADGNMCKDCGKKLAVWSKDHSSTTIDQMREQLAEREENARLVSRFSPTLEIGGSQPFIKIDENMGRFVILRNGESMDKNPELLELDKVGNVRVDVKEENTEVRYKDAQGHMHSYMPKHYHYRYRFIVQMDYNGKWFQQLEFPLNTVAIDGGEDGEHYDANASQFHTSLFDQLGLNPAFTGKPQAQYANRDRLPGGWRNGPTTMRETEIKKYELMMQTGAQLTDYFLNRMMNRTRLQSAVRQPAQPDGTWTCACGAVCTGNFCENCGSRRS